MQLKNKIADLRNKLSKLEEKRIAKELNKYVGKYYKFQNCYSNRKNWFEYLKVLKLNNDNNLECLLFYKDADSICHIEKNYVSMSYSDLRNEWTEITEQEFILEWKKILSEINSYYK